MAQKYRAAVIGLGQIGSRYQEDKRRTGIVSHAAAYASHPLCELVAGCDPDPAQRERFRKRWKKVRVYSGIDALLLIEKPDIVSLCTPPDTHPELIKKSLASNAKAIFCEKPIATDLSKAVRILRLPQNGKVIAVNVSRRWDKMHQRIAREIRQNRWGKLQVANAYYTGAFSNTASHLVDGLRMMLGDISWVQSLPPHEKNPERGLQAILSFDQGGYAFLHPMDRRHYLIYEIDLFFSKGRIRIRENGFSADFWKSKRSKHFHGFHELSLVKHDGSGYRHVFQNALDDIIHCVKTKKDPLGNLKDSITFLKVQKALIHSAKQAGKKVSI